MGNLYSKIKKNYKHNKKEKVPQRITHSVDIDLILQDNEIENNSAFETVDQSIESNTHSSIVSEPEPESNVNNQEQIVSNVIDPRLETNFIESEHNLTENTNDNNDEVIPFPELTVTDSEKETDVNETEPNVTETNIDDNDEVIPFPELTLTDSEKETDVNEPEPTVTETVIPNDELTVMESEIDMDVIEPEPNVKDTNNQTTNDNNNELIPNSKLTDLKIETDVIDPKYDGLCMPCVSESEQVVNEPESVFSETEPTLSEAEQDVTISDNKTNNEDNDEFV